MNAVTSTYNINMNLIIFEVVRSYFIYFHFNLNKFYYNTWITFCDEKKLKFSQSRDSASAYKINMTRYVIPSHNASFL